MTSDNEHDEAKRAIEVIKMRESGHSYVKIEEVTGISRITLYKIFNKKEMYMELV
ncbi:MAG: hypothetical protein BTN85_1067 [Candidatus Methanohalarchaeum thermophilum]|uniref:Resolvase HTH domain-containing protein n=1 Tax=Methanohalarchaeum thermophilum TaxID=1903181 RepID=A0A1Q6DW10_METT1|nr:MAG: hypothetical protein BTN85_1067 [Candidatus Methanohalarchaeum thermophilum]